MSVPSKVALAAFALDPGLLAEYCINSVEPWQKDVVCNRGNDLVLAHRQRGKSTGIAAKVLWEMLFMPYSFNLFFSTTEQQSAELFRKFMAFYQPFRKLFPPEQESEMRLRIAGGNRILVMPSKADSVRGYSAATRLVLDEAFTVKDELYLTALPILSRTPIPGGGKISALGNAGFDAGWFFDVYTKGGQYSESDAVEHIRDDWHRWFVPAEGAAQAAPYHLYSEEWRLAMVEGTYGIEKYEREWGARFTRLKGTQAGGFSKEVVDAAYSDDIKPIEWA